MKLTVALRRQQLIGSVIASFGIRGSRLEQLFWTGKAAVVMPPDTSGVKRIQRVGGSDYFLSESEVLDHLLSQAKQWIDNEIAGYNSLPCPCPRGWRIVRKPPLEQPVLFNGNV